MHPATFHAVVRGLIAFLHSPIAKMDPARAQVIALRRMEEAHSRLVAR